MRKEINKTPIRPGLIFEPVRGRWVNASARKPGSIPITSSTVTKLSDPDLRELHRSTGIKLSEKLGAKEVNDLYRVRQVITKEIKRRTVTKMLSKAAKFHRRLAADEVVRGTEVFLLKGVSIEAAIPIEQIKNDLGRAGHTVKSLIALDPDSHRLFFMDVRDNPLYAEFSDASGGFQIQRVGFQHEIAKEYDVIDLEPDDSEETVVTTNDEEDYNDSPGMIPGPTPNVKPDTDKKYFEEHGHGGDGLGDTGFPTEDRPKDGRDIEKTLSNLNEILR